MKRVCLAVVLAFFALGGLALAQVPESDRIRVTDPALLQSMGFSPNDQNVYVHSSVAQNVVPQDVSAQDFGGGFHFTPVPAKAFIGRQDTAGAPWQYSGGEVGCCVNLNRLGTEPFADAVIDLPTGANIAAIRFWANDTNAGSDLDFFVFEVCAPGFSGGANTITTIATGATTGATGYQGGVLAGSGITVNNSACSYVARVNFTAITGLTFQKFRVQWNRQVSPAPATATFADVPTSSPYHRFIEALVAAGITGGCGPGVYCPDQPVTRAQMAVFLSVALGLYWQ